METEKLKDIIRNNRMSTRPEYYSGRGAIRCDLDGEILQGIYSGILKEFGKVAANNYVKMVDDIKIISATTFLQELYMLQYNDWKYKKKKKHADGISVPKNKNGEYDESSMMSGMMGIFASMGNTRDETQSIKGGFLQSHGIISKGRIVTRHGDCVYYEDEEGRQYMNRI